MDIVGLEYRSFTALRGLVANERHQQWLELAGGSNMAFDKLMEKQKKMYADTDLESTFGTWNVILAKMDAVDAKLNENLAALATEKPCNSPDV